MNTPNRTDVLFSRSLVGMKEVRFVMMDVYFIARIQVEDTEMYQHYLDSCDEIFARFNGKYLAVDESPIVLEGEWACSKVVLIRFPSETEFYRWYHSPEYQQILTHRLKAAKCDTVLIKGKHQDERTG
jgi:uncharacterized protein (DUF1330 family)